MEIDVLKLATIITALSVIFGVIIGGCSIRKFCFKGANKWQLKNQSR